MPDLLTPEELSAKKSSFEATDFTKFECRGFWPITPCMILARDVRALYAHIAAQQERIERLERILAAEQGREGLEGWRWAGDCWERIVFGPKRLGPPSPLARAWPGGRLWTRHDNWLRGAGHDCLEAMEAAEAALRGEG
jgi:hypothetical protein